MTRRPTVLFVDDDVDTREMYMWSLEARGFEAIGAGSVGTALAIADERQPDVIVTDFTLPGEDGLFLAGRMRESRRADTPLVLVSGRAFVGDSGARAASLFDRVLLKPVLPDQLIAEIVPLVLDRTAAALARQLRDVRQALQHIPTGSAVGRVLSAVEAVGGASAPAALLVDSSAHYIGVNDAACTLTGRSRSELLSLSIWDLTPPISPSIWKQQWSAFVDAGSQTGAYRLAGPTGTPIETCFAAVAHVLPDCHLSLIAALPPALIGVAVL